MVFAACFLDRLLGEPTRWHPLVGFGMLAQWLEKRCNLASLNTASGKWRGLLCWLLLVVIPAIALAALLTPLSHYGQIMLGALCLYSAIGGRALQEHSDRVSHDLEMGDIPAARTHVSWLVSRETNQLDETGISRACIESVLENGSDALFAPIFWFCVLGPAGAVLYRLANTLDAMWGYRTPRYQNFGLAAARLDDVLNYLPARLTALTYALIGNTAQALHCWQTQAPVWDSPNAGPVMASGAGALNLRLGGAAFYHGATKQRPNLGTGKNPSATDIPLAQNLVRKSLYIWLAVICLMALISRFA